MTNLAMRAYSSGASCFHHSILGPWSQVGGQPVSRVTRSPACASICSMYGWQRMSSQESKRVAGRKSSSIEPIPAICESKAIAATWRGIDAALLDAGAHGLGRGGVKIVVFLLDHPGRG